MKKKCSLKPKNKSGDTYAERDEKYERKKTKKTMKAMKTPGIATALEKAASKKSYSKLPSLKDVRY